MSKDLEGAEKWVSVSSRALGHSQSCLFKRGGGGRPEGQVRLAKTYSRGKSLGGGEGRSTAVES